VREEISQALVAGHSIRSIATSPAQIDGWLKRTHPDNEHYQMSHETIYRSLYIQAHGALKKELLSI